MVSVDAWCAHAGDSVGLTAGGGDAVNLCICVVNNIQDSEEDIALGSQLTRQLVDLTSQQTCLNIDFLDETVRHVAARSDPHSSVALTKTCLVCSREMLTCGPLCKSKSFAEHIELTSTLLLSCLSRGK
jgi:hypothetical protein